MSIQWTILSVPKKEQFIALTNKWVEGENLIHIYNESFQYILKHCGTDQYFNMYRNDALSSIFISYLIAEIGHVALQSTSISNRTDKLPLIVTLPVPSLSYSLRSCRSFWILGSRRIRFFPLEANFVFGLLVIYCVSLSYVGEWPKLLHSIWIWISLLANYRSRLWFRFCTILFCVKYACRNIHTAF